MSEQASSYKVVWWYDGVNFRASTIQIEQPNNINATRGNYSITVANKVPS